MAEGIADKLMTAISKGETDVADLAALSGAAHVNSVSSFSSGANAKEFFFALETRNNISGYKIYVRVNDDKGKQLAYITAFASVGGGTT